MRLPVTELLWARQATTSTTLEITGNVTDTTLHLPTSQPAWAEKIDPQIASSFSIEMDHWPDWAGNATGQGNAFVNQALSHFTERTGAPAFFRVGANSEDQATLDLSFQVMNATFPTATEAVPAPEADHISIGKDFYALSGNLPAGTDFHWGFNLKIMNQTETLAQAKHCVDSFARSGLKKMNLKYIEFGNEPDFYGGISTITPGYDQWDAYNYTTTWSTYAKAALSFLPKNTKLVPGSFANLSPTHGTLTWNTLVPFINGILGDKKVAKQVDEWSMHMYHGVFDPTVPIHIGTLMDKGNIFTNISQKADDVVRVKSQGLRYFLSEGNSYANHGVPGMSNGGEQTLWSIQQLLKGASMGIQRLHFHNGRGFKYNVIQPVALTGTGVDDGTNRQDRPHVMPLYYGMLIVNEAIGKSGNAYVVELTSDNLNLASFGIFEKGKLVRVVLVNTQVYTSDMSARNGIKVTLPGVGKASLRRFKTAYTDSTSGWTWAAQDFDTATTDPSGSVVNEQVIGGVVELEASSAVLITL